MCLDPTVSPDTFDTLGVQAARIVHKLAHDLSPAVVGQECGATDDLLSTITPQFPGAHEDAVREGMVIFIVCFPRLGFGPRGRQPSDDDCAPDDEWR